MKLQVKNLGPIKKGEIDLDKRFYVFVGYNNSGKTYMSQVMWSLFELWEGKNLGLTKMLDVIECLQVNLEKLDGEVLITEEQLKDVLQIYYNEAREKIINNFNINNNSSSLRDFEISFLEILSFFKKKDICFDYEIGLENSYLRLEKYADSLGILVSEQPKSNKNPSLRPFFKDIDGHNIFPELSYAFYDFITSAFHQIRIEDSTFFLPANRSFYPSFYKFIYAALDNDLKEAQKAIKNKTAYTFNYSYTMAANSLISNIYNLNLGNNQANFFYEDLIKDLQKVIGGDIVSRSSNPDIASLATFKLKMENSEELDMHLSSSSVNQLTTLYLYFKYWAKEEGNTLIIDEPEENLHPKNQLGLLNILMKFANRDNNRVIITTHSPLMTDAVNNHLHLGYLSEKYEKNVAEIIKEHEIDIDAEAAMKHHDIGIYFFNGNSIKEYDVEEYGVDFKDFRKEQEKVADTGNVLRSLILKEKKNKIKEKSQILAADV